ncbi:uncharacterized protein LOC134656061 [Cydia amplana]|uniref:uncharacterized protein LOC134656061 n=1 Tax=Cydia amplana TaxID=1869771 RepID=UPI002FE67AC8
MWQRNLFSVTLVAVCVSCEKDMSGSRKPRLFTFNTMDQDISVGLDFSIPFLSIPVKPTVDNVFGSIGMPTVNVNLQALVLGGGLVIASTFLIPLLLKSYAHHPPYDRYAKKHCANSNELIYFIFFIGPDFYFKWELVQYTAGSKQIMFSITVLEHTQFGADGVLDFASNVLSGGMQGCALRVACWSGQHDHEDGAKFWTGVLSNQLVSSLVNSTAVEDAIASGRRGRDCSVYSPCPLNAQHYPMLMKNLMQLSNIS